MKLSDEDLEKCWELTKDGTIGRKLASEELTRRRLRSISKFHQSLTLTFTAAKRSMFSIKDLENIEQRAASAYDELKEAHTFQHVIPPIMTAAFAALLRILSPPTEKLLTY